MRPYRTRTATPDTLWTTRKEGRGGTKRDRRPCRTPGTTPLRGSQSRGPANASGIPLTDSRSAAPSGPPGTGPLWNFGGKGPCGVWCRPLFPVGMSDCPLPPVTPRPSVAVIGVLGHDSAPPDALPGRRLPFAHGCAFTRVPWTPVFGAPRGPQGSTGQDGGPP